MAPLHGHISTPSDPASKLLKTLCQSLIAPLQQAPDSGEARARRTTDWNYVERKGPSSLVVFMGSAWRCNSFQPLSVLQSRL